MSTEKQELKKDLGLVSTLALVVGSVLGAGAFMKPAAVLAVTGDTSFALLAWLIGAFFSMAGGLTLCELGALFPRTGGIFVFLEVTYGSKVAYLYGWMMTVLYGPAVVGALTGYFSSVFCLLFGVPENHIILVSGGVLLFILFINSVGVKEAGYLQTLATSCKLIPVILIMVFGIWKGNGQFLSESGKLAATAPFSIAILATLFAYDGWANVAALAGEMKNPAKILPRAIIGGLIFLSLVYVLINIAFFKILPPEQMVALGHDAAAIAAQKLFGLYGGNVIAVGIMISILGGLNGYVMTISRLIYVLGDRELLPCSRAIGKIDGDSCTPVNATIVLTAMAFAYSQMLDADRLSDIAMFGVWIFFVLSFYAVFIARKKYPDMIRPYKVPLYPIVPIIAIVGAVYIVYGMLISYTFNAVMAIILTLAGMPVYWLMKGEKKVAVPTLRKKYIILVCGVLLLMVFSATSKIFDNRPILTVAVETSNPPIVFENQKGEPDGLDVEIIKNLADKSGYRVVFKATEWSNLLTAVERGIADVAIGEITITHARQEVVDFTDSYYESGLAMVVANNDSANDIMELSGKTVGVKTKTTGADYAQEYAGTVKVEAIDTTGNLVALFNKGEIAAIIYDKPILEKLLASGEIKSGRLVTIDRKEKYGFVYNKDNKALGKKLNDALKVMTDEGELAKIVNKWLQ